MYHPQRWPLQRRAANGAARSGLLHHQPPQPLLEHPVLGTQLLHFFKQVQRQGDAFPFQLQVAPQFRGAFGQGQFDVVETPLPGLCTLRFEDAVFDDFDAANGALSPDVRKLW